MEEQKKTKDRLPVEPLQAALHADDVVLGLPAPENKKFYPALDGIRAIAVLMVFFQHYLGRLKPTLSWGWSGVDMFFVLSGFLITGILFDTRNAAHRFRNFYMRRMLRIFPLYYGVLLFALLLTPYFHWKWHPAVLLWPLYLSNYVRFIWMGDWLRDPQIVDHLVSSLPFQPPAVLFFSHFWSLCVEEQFYLVWPLVVFLLRDRIRLRNLCFAVVALCLAMRVLCALYLPPVYIRAELLYRLTPLRADALLLGGALALMLRGPEAARLMRMARPLFVCFVVGFAAFQVFCRITAHHFYYPRNGVLAIGTFGYTLIDIFAGLVLLLSLSPSGMFYRILSLKPLRRLGQVSYGFYIFHDIPHTAYHALARQISHSDTSLSTVLLTAAIGLCSTLALSFLSFYFFEAPFLRLKDRFTI